MNKKLGIGILGCGNISSYYIKMLPFFKGIEIKAIGIKKLKFWSNVKDIVIQYKLVKK